MGKVERGDGAHVDGTEVVGGHGVDAERDGWVHHTERDDDAS